MLFALMSIVTIQYVISAEDNLPTGYLQLKEMQNEYQILQEWEEKPLSYPEHLINGVLCEETRTGKVLELYFKNGNRLSERELNQLGIQKKTGQSIGDVSVFSEPARSVVKETKKISGTESIQKLIKELPFSPPTVTLPPLQTQKLLEEEKKSITSTEKGVFRIGIIQELSQPIEVYGQKSSTGLWQVLSDASSLWAVDIQFPNSIGIRVKIDPLFENTDSDANAFFWVLNPDKNADEFWGPFSPKDIKNMGGWLPTCFSEHVYVLCHVSQNQPADAIGFLIKEVIGIYKDPISLLTKAGSCNLDVTCYPEWAETSRGILGLGIVGSPYALFCTATLLNDHDSCTQIPYVLTANHCVSSQTGTRGADTLEFYWFYQTSTCNGTPPSLSTVPRTTGGADYLVGSGGSAYYGLGNDFTLLKMRNEPPENATYVGWTTSAIAIGTPVTDIHHPSGSYKRISFGHKTNTDNPYSSLYHEVTWDEGTTEPGSSGSPLMLTGTQQIIGQLWGGGASCDTPEEPDYFGRFNITYNLAQSYLEQPKVQFYQETLLIEEQNTTQQITILLSAPARSSGGEVEIGITSENATEGIDFDLNTHFISFLPNTTQMTLTLTFYDNTHIDGDKIVVLSLKNPQCLRLDTTKINYEITILDNDPDSDGDGLSDYDETNGVYGFPSDPNRVDTDNDGLTDVEEVRGIYGYVSNPNLRDTDRDRVNDWLEARFGTDPTNPYDAPPLPSLPIPWFK
ncbi:MAG: serine protease [Candidatus Hydrogenedens sp.]|nr:serine protease [Candidatus Hydrogenedens sp.]